MFKKRIWSLFAPLIVFSISMDARAQARGQGKPARGSHRQQCQPRRVHIALRDDEKYDTGERLLSQRNFGTVLTGIRG